MGTLVLCDVSLSMGRCVGSGPGEGESGRRLVAAAVKAFADSLRALNPHESLALASFSDAPRLHVPWTKDWDSVAAAAAALEPGTKRLLPTALRWASEQLCQTFAHGLPLSLLLLTDSKPLSRDQLAAVLPFPQPVRLHYFVLAPKASLPAEVQEDMGWLVEALGKEDEEAPAQPIFLQSASVGEVEEAVEELVQTNYAPASSSLFCGQLSAPVSIFPPPPEPTERTETGERVARLGSRMDVLGFLKPTEWGNPAVLSRHLLLPAGQGGEATKPNLCVLLHGALKTESSVAVVRVGLEWYGFLHHLDSKRSNLVLYTLRPGSGAVPWLGRLRSLELVEWTGEAATKSPFTAELPPRPSYSSGPITVWTERSSLASDLAKVPKYARKLPERRTQFYAELNRLVRHALSIGAPEILRRLDATLQDLLVTHPSPQLAPHVAHLHALLSQPAKLNYALPIPPI